MTDITKRDVSIAVIVAVFLLIGIVVGAGALQCAGSCPTFTQDHFNRFVDFILYLGIAGITYLGIKAAKAANINVV